MAQYLSKTFQRMEKYPGYKALLYILGIFSLPIVFITYLKNKSGDTMAQLKSEIEKEYKKQNKYESIYQVCLEQVRNKVAFFETGESETDIVGGAKKLAEKKYADQVAYELARQAQEEGVGSVTLNSTFANLFENRLFLFFSVLVSFPMYILMLLFSNPYAKYISERLFMMLFVLFGVTCLVFTILYLSPMDPAANILGQTATAEQIAEFNRIHGLDQPYIVQLFNAVRKLFTFDLGKSYLGNEDIMAAILRKFPITLRLTFISLLIAVAIAIPAGIVSAIKQYSMFDYVFMLFALIGLSIPTFWMGLVLILNFSIKLNLLPATFIAGDWKTLIMPSIVLGTSLAATVARMTRSSMLEVKNMDYIVTARAKGLSERRVVMKHILGNAMIPIVTVIGLQFGAMMGGSAVTEKVFNINGIGSFIVDKQFVPDVPVVLAGVVYVAVIISLVNLVVDILYAFLDPRIKSKMKAY